jgi:hypothetical protein
MSRSHNQARRNNMGPSSLGAALAESGHHLARSADLPDGFEGQGETIEDVDRVERTEVAAEPPPRRAPHRAPPAAVSDNYTEEAAEQPAEVQSGRLRSAVDRVRGFDFGKIVEGVRTFFRPHRPSRLDIAVFGTVVLVVVGVFLFFREDSTRAPSHPSTASVTAYKRIAVIRATTHGWFSSASSSRAEPQYVVDSEGNARIVPPVYVKEVDKWLEGDTVTLPATFSAWLPAYAGVSKEQWKALTDSMTPCTLPDKSAELWPTHVFVSVDQPALAVASR